MPLNIFSVARIFADEYLKLPKDYYIVSYYNDLATKGWDCATVVWSVETLEVKINLISHNTLDDLLDTFFHELVHINQIHKGLLVCYTDGYDKWKGKSVNSYARQLNAKWGSEYEAYFRLPWEKQAYRIANNMLKKFKKSKDYARLCKNY